MDYWSDLEDEIFEHQYRCYSEKSSLETGDKIIMPRSALDRLAYLHIDYPMLFEMINPSVEIFSHCGVLEFTADEGEIYVPDWMMENMFLNEGDLVILRSTNLPKGTFLKLQPHTKDFLDISDSKEVLETILRSHSCLTTGDTIMIAYNNKKYYIDVVETKPSSAVCIIDTDCEVDFAPPLDFKEPEKKPLPYAVKEMKRPEPEVEEKLAAEKTARIIPFTGCGRHLNGKPSTTQSIEFASSSMLKQQQPNNETKTSSFKLSNIVLGRRKPMFRLNGNTDDKIVKQPKASRESTSTSEDSSEN